MNYRRIMFGYVTVCAIAHLLLNLIHPNTLYSEDDDGLNAGDHRSQRGCVLCKTLKIKRSTNLISYELQEHGSDPCCSIRY